MIFSGQSVVEVKKDALLVELDLLATVHCPRIIAVLDGPYCAKVGLLFSPFLTPRCCPNKFSTISELRKPGFMLCFPWSIFLQRDINPMSAESRSVRVSRVIRCLEGTSITDFFTAFSHDLK